MTIVINSLREELYNQITGCFGKFGGVKLLGLIQLLLQYLWKMGEQKRAGSAHV